MQNNLQNVLQKPMTRKQFLLTAGLSVLVISGISGTLKKLNKFADEKPHPKQSTGYGSKGYKTYS